MNYYIKNYKNKPIFYCCYNNCQTEEEMTQLSIDVYNEAVSMNPIGGHLLLCNFSGRISTKKFLEENRKFGLKASSIASKIAVIGVLGARIFIVDSYMLFTGHRNIRCFRNERDAQKWLIR